MSTGKGFEAIHQFSASAAIRVRADVRCDKHPVLTEDVANDGIDKGRSDATEVGLTTRQQIRSRLAKHELHALSDHEGRRKRKSETHPTNVPLPELPPPNERLGSSSASCWSGDEEHADYEDDAGGDDECDKDEEPCWNGFVVLEGVRDVEIDG